MALERELEKLHELFGSTRIALQNNVDGPLTITGNVGEILKHYVTDNSLIRLIIAAVQGHLSQYKDNGMFLGLLITSIVRSYYTDGCEAHPKAYSNVLSWCSEHSQQVLQAMNCKFKVNTESISALLYNTLSTQLLEIVGESGLKSLTKQLAEIFVMTEGNRTCNMIQYIKYRDTQHHTQLHKGVLLDSHHSNTLLPSSTYKTVLVEFSMSGDNNEIDDVLYAGFEESVMSEGVISRLERLVSCLADKEVDLIICQRVIHPRVKVYIEHRGIRYLERLGNQLNKLSILTGCLTCRSLTMKPEGMSTCVLSCTHKSLGADTWLLIDSDHSSHYCLAIASWSEKISSEIQGTCEQALDTLRLALHDSRLLPIDWLSILTQNIQTSAEAVSTVEARKMGVTPASFRSIVSSYLKCIQSSYNRRGESTMTDITPTALWISYHTALSTAVSISNAVIMTGQTLQTI